MLTQHDHSIIKKAYGSFKAGNRLWAAPNYGGNLSPQEIGLLRDELVVSIQHAYTQAEKNFASGTKFAQLRFTQWVSEHYDIFVLDPVSLKEKRAWREYEKQLRTAIKFHRVDDVKQLITNCPAASNNVWPQQVYFVSLLTAVDSEHVPIVEMLLPLANPKERNSWVLQKASIKDHAQLMDVLYDVCEPLKALDVLRSEYPNDYSKWQPLEQRIESERLHAVLTQHIDPNPTHSARKM